MDSPELLATTGFASLPSATPMMRGTALALAASSRALEDQSILEGASVLDADAGPGPPDLGPLAE